MLSKNPDKMRAEKMPMSLATKKRKRTFPKQFQGSRGALVCRSAGGEKRGRVGKGRWLG